MRVHPVRHKPQERQVWGCMPGIPELARLRQNDNLEAKASLSCLETLCLETKTKIKKAKKQKTSSCLGDNIGAAHIFQMEKVRPP